MTSFTSFRLVAPLQLVEERVEVPPGPTGPDSARLRLLAGAICGSDLAKYRGVPDPRWAHDGEPGFPLHEVVAEVLSDPSGRFEPGDRVVGMSSEFRGLAAEFFADPELLVAVPDGVCDVHATIIQPLATILCSVSRMPAVEGRRVAIVGLGSIGALFAHVLSEHAETVVAFDPVDRSDLAPAFGVDRTVLGASRAAVSLPADDEVGPGSFDLVVEAVGHQAGTFADSVRLARAGAHVVAFGVPDDSHYAVPMVEMFRKQLTVQLGETTNWRDHLERSAKHLVEKGAALDAYVTDVFDLGLADQAFRAAAEPKPGQLKVALSAGDGATGIDRGSCLFAVPRRHTADG